MGANSKIEWTDYSFNPWVGCTKVSPACDHCYAEAWAKRTGKPELWQGERRRTTAAYWRQPIKWNAEAKRTGKRARVFCASLADVFDNHVPEQWRADLWELIGRTRHLDWLLLTKRPQNIAKMLPTKAIGAPEWGDGWPNVWLGTTVENQTEADRRIPHLLNVPARVRFLSCEPLLGAVDLEKVRCPPDPVDPDSEWLFNSLDVGDYYQRRHENAFGEVRYESGDGPYREARLDWIIVGGESGPGARPMDLAWTRSIVAQCRAAGVPCFVKQLGSATGFNLHDRKGGDMAEWPADLRVREMPR